MMASAQQLSPSVPHSQSFPSLSKEVIRACEEGIEYMELIAELLLLRSGSKAKALYPVSRAGESYSKARDAIVANTKALAISIKDLTKQLKEEKLSEVEHVIQQIADKVTVLTESAAHAAYVTAMCDTRTVSSKPGVVDQYAFAKARYIISLTCSKFNPHRGVINNDMLLELTQTIATNLSLLRQGCQHATENESLAENDRAQFNACVQCLDGTSALFVACVKSFITTGRPSDRKNMAVFTTPLKAAVNSVVEYGSLSEFAGSPAQLTARGEQSQTEILAGAMAIVSSSVQMLNTVVSLLEYKNGTEKNGDGSDKKGNKDEKHWQRLVSCARAVADSCKMLASSIREHTPHPSPDSSPPIARTNPLS